ncbi:MAG: amidophosphoribosyltransferase, partial [Epsilonproteobacteria bacterium]|nr:amidophosphoribosyltransferase [Campylobacterota bacterium]
MCAIVGVFDVKHASKIAYYALFAMQHRGQEATGISASNGKKIRTIKDNGLVTEVFN